MYVLEGERCYINGEFQSEGNTYKRMSYIRYNPTSCILSKTASNEVRSSKSGTGCTYKTSHQLSASCKRKLGTYNREPNTQSIHVLIYSSSSKLVRRNTPLGLQVPKHKQVVRQIPIKLGIKPNREYALVIPSLAVGGSSQQSPRAQIGLGN